MRDWIIQYWLELVFGSLMAFVTASIARLKKSLDKKQIEQDALKDGLLAILHDRLFEICKYYLELGYIPSEDAEEIMDNAAVVYKAYHNLGGNGTGTKIYEKFCSLKIKAKVEVGS